MNPVRSIIKAAYDRLPAKRQVFTLLRSVYVPPPALYQHLHFRGQFEVRVDGRTLLINHDGFDLENQIFWGGLCGGREGGSMKLWIELCRGARCVFDIGANTGIYGLVAKTVNPDARVVAFEPVHRVYERLKRNCADNRFDIQCVEKALSNYDGRAKIFDTGDEHIYSVTVNKNLQSSDTKVHEVEIETARLDSFIRSIGQLPPIDLMKIDVETHEGEVLEGMGKCLAEYRPSLLIEILNDEVAQSVERRIQGLDYLRFDLDDEGPPRFCETLRKSSHWNFLLCSRERARWLKLL